MKNKINIKVMAEIAIFVALAFVINLLQNALFTGLYPNGGAIGIANVAIFIICYRRGFKAGLIATIIYMVVKMLGGTLYVVTQGEFANKYVNFFGVATPFIQIALDYVIATLVLCVAGLFSKKYHNAKTTKSKLIYVGVGCALAGTLKYLSHVFAGYFWLVEGAYWGKIHMGDPIYTWLYNGSCMIPTMILETIIMIIIAKKYSMFLNPKEEANEN